MRHSTPELLGRSSRGAGAALAASSRGHRLVVGRLQLRRRQRGRARALDLHAPALGVVAGGRLLAG
eukprot:6720544-Pyramimonas_sp.AAC.1